MKTNVGLIWLMVVISTFFWGSNFNAGHAVAGDVTPLTAAAERFAIALVLFWAIRFSFGKAESQLSLRDFCVLIPLGLVGVFGFNYAFFTALHTTSALNAALIMALSPMVSTLLSIILLNAKIRLFQYTGMLIAFIGVTFVITGGQDNVQAVAGQMLTFWAELGFVFPQFPFIAHSRGWDAEDMETNVRLVRESAALKAAARELAERAVDFCRILHQHTAELEKPMERTGRKAQREPGTIIAEADLG